MKLKHCEISPKPAGLFFWLINSFIINFVPKSSTYLVATLASAQVNNGEPKTAIFDT